METKHKNAKYKDVINDICSNIHTGLIDFSEPRSKASAPTQASSEFITNKQQGDWAEDVLFRAINEHSENIVAVRYGKSDDIVAGEDGFKEFYERYQSELDAIGKRPDLLLFRKADFDADLGLDISTKDSNEIGNYVTKAIAGIEVRSSSYLINKYTEETNRILRCNIERVFSLRDILLSDYNDLLEQKRPELITILKQYNESTIRTLNFKSPSWHSSKRLQEMSTLLSELKQCLKVIQKKRNNLSMTPKVEDLKVVHKWIMTYNVPHFYVQVFFDRIYGMSFKHIMELVSDPNMEGEKYYVEKDSKNQQKKTIKISPFEGVCLAQTVTEPKHRSVRKELRMGNLLFYVTFDGGEAYLDKENFDTLFACKL